MPGLRIRGAHPCALPLRGQLRRYAAPLFTFGFAAESANPRVRTKLQDKKIPHKAGLFVLAGRLGYTAHIRVRRPFGASCASLRCSKSAVLPILSNVVRSVVSPGRKANGPERGRLLFWLGD